MHEIRRRLFYFILVILIVGCAGPSKMQVGETQLVESYGDPEYKTKTGKSAYIGVSKDFSDESSARNDAELDARRKIINSLEMRLSNDIIDRYLVQGERGEIIIGEVFQDRVTKAVAENIIAVKPEGYYVEKWAKGTPYSIEYYFKCWCRIDYSREEHNKTVGKAIDEFLKLATPALDKGRQYQKIGFIRDALRQYNSTLDWATEFDGYKGVDPSLLTKVRAVKYQVNELLASISMLIAVCDCENGRLLGTNLFESRLAQTLTKTCGFAVRSSLDWSGLNPDRLMVDGEVQLAISRRYNADLILIGIANIDEVKKISENIYIAKNRVHLKLVEGATGTVLWEMVIPGATIEDNRTFANNRESVIKRALTLVDQESIEPFNIISRDILQSLK